MIEIKSVNEFEETVKTAEDLILIDFYGRGCGPCRQFAPIFEELAAKYEPDGILFGKAEVHDVFPVLAKYGVTSIPQLFFFKVDKITGEPAIKARLLFKDMKKDNIEALITEYRNEVPLK